MQAKSNKPSPITPAPRLEDIIEAADQIELRAVDIETGETRRYKTSVQDFTKEGILVSLPTDKGVSLSVTEGSVFIVSLWKNYADYLFKSKILKKVKGSLPMLLLSIPDPASINRNVRREFFRVDTRISTRLYMTDDMGKRAIVDGLMMDLSGGGGRMQVYEQLRVDIPVVLDFDLPFDEDSEGNDRSKPVRKLAAHIRSCASPAENARDPETKRRIYMLGIEFGDIDNVLHNNLLRYVAYRQRELLSTEKEGDGEKAKKRQKQDGEIAASLDILERELADACQGVPAIVKKVDAAPPAVDAPPSPAAPSPPAAGAPSKPPAVPSPPAAAPPLPAAKSPSVAAPPPPAAKSPSTPAVAEPLPPSAMPVQSARKTVLLVEDEALLRQVMVEALTHFGYDTIEAEDGKRGLELALSRDVDLIITDLMMPRMNGWRLIASLRERGVDLPIIIVTGYMNEEGLEVLTSKDVSSFLVKPVDLEEMQRVVKRAIGGGASAHVCPRILAVDDEEDMRLMVSTCLEKAGFEVQTASSGLECLQKVPNFKPDLVLLDIVMPGLSGFDVCNQLRSQPTTNSLPIIMLTAKGSAEDVRKAVSFKINGYMVKPFDPDVLVARIRKTLSSSARTGRPK